MDRRETSKQVDRSDRRKRRLVVVADNSLIVEAIAIGLRNSGEFDLLGHVDGRTGDAHTIAEARPDVVLMDDMERSERAIEMVRGVRAELEDVAVIVLTMSMEPEWLNAIFGAGAIGTISKATHPAALATLVRETVDGNILVIDRSLALGPDGTAAGAPPLTLREFQVLQLVAAGSTNSDIASELWVTEQTVKFHLSNIYRKLRVGNRTEASRYAHVNSLVSVSCPPAAARSSG